MLDQSNSDPHYVLICLQVSQAHMCNYCNYTTAKRYLLARHMKSHSEERPHKCSVCERGFKTLASLQNHVNTHTGTVGARITNAFRIRILNGVWIVVRTIPNQNNSKWQLVQIFVKIKRKIFKYKMVQAYGHFIQVWSGPFKNRTKWPPFCFFAIQNSNVRYLRKMAGGDIHRQSPVKSPDIKNR